MESTINTQMEEIAKTAEAYYSKLPAANKQKAKDMFEAIDVDGNGTITYEEYITFLGSSDLGLLQKRKFFDLFDGDKSGALDFNEFLGWHYLLLTERYYNCNRCGVFLTGVYFTCSSCFYSDTTYDLCPSCYKNCNSISHQHSADVFLDNYALLLLTRKIALDQKQDEGQGVAVQRGSTSRRVATGLSIASSIVDIATNCSIM